MKLTTDGSWSELPANQICHWSASGGAGTQQSSRRSIWLRWWNSAVCLRTVLWTQVQQRWLLWNFHNTCNAANVVTSGISPSLVFSGGERVNPRVVLTPLLTPGSRVNTRYCGQADTASNMMRTCVLCLLWAQLKSKWLVISYGATPCLKIQSEANSSFLKTQIKMWFPENSNNVKASSMKLMGSLSCRHIINSAFIF